MTNLTHHRIIGVKLITMDDQEPEPATDVEWSLDIWRADGMQTTSDRTLGAGSLVERGDADLSPFI